MDKRRNNGNKGHSTKAKGLDRRKNPYKDVLSEVSTPEDVKDVLEKLKKTAKDGDFNAIKLYLSYYLGNPRDSIDITSGDAPIQNFNLSQLSEKELAVILKLHNERQSTDTDKE